MKRTLLTLSLATLVVGFVMSQSIVNGYRTGGGKPETYDIRTPPPLSLPEAYNLALTALLDTNQFHCVLANCTEMTNRGITGWKFVFASTNGEFADVDVFFDKLVLSDFVRDHNSVRLYIAPAVI